MADRWIAHLVVAVNRTGGVLAAASDNVSVAADTVNNSYFLHFDPVSNPVETVRATASVHLTDEIVGNRELIDSDFTLGVIGQYTKDPRRGLKFVDVAGLTLFDDNHGFRLNLSTLSSDIDQLRLITNVAVVPLPAAWQMALVGLAVMGMVRGRHRIRWSRRHE